MAKTKKQELFGKRLPLTVRIRNTVPLFELKHGNLHQAEFSLPRGESVTVEEIHILGNCQDLFEAGKMRLFQKVYWASVRDLKQNSSTAVA